ncbi:hypothetical protein OUZ56_021881, partial [Daphnia magna]
NHFDERDIIKGYSVLVEGKPTIVPYKRLRLKPDAVPCIFPSRIKIPKDVCWIVLPICPIIKKKGNALRKEVTQHRSQSTVTATTGFISIAPMFMEPASSTEIEPGVAVTIPSTTTTIPETAIQENTSTTGWETDLKKNLFSPVVDLPEDW